MATLPKEIDRLSTVIMENVCDLLNCRSAAFRGCEVYAFGSVLLGGSRWADVDILVVSETDEITVGVMEALAPLAAVVPLDLTIVLRSEFEELGPTAWGRIHKLAQYQ